MALKIDLEKAYDMLDHNYIQACLQKMGFHNRWIAQMLSLIPYSLMAMPKVFSATLGSFDKGILYTHISSSLHGTSH